MTTTGNKVVYPLAPCPWCKNLPSIHFYFTQGTWLPKIICKSSVCRVNPESKPQVIRKTCKVDIIRLKKKISDLFQSWNDQNPIIAKEGKEIDFDHIVMMGKIDEERRKN